MADLHAQYKGPVPAPAKPSIHEATLVRLDDRLCNPTDAPLPDMEIPYCWSATDYALRDAVLPSEGASVSDWTSTPRDHQMTTTSQHTGYDMTTDPVAAAVPIDGAGGFLLIALAVLSIFAVYKQERNDR